ncbi:ABC transporter ATP-binding protein [Streptomyces sp. NPDC055092]
MRGGRIVEQGTAAEVYEDPQHSYTQTLLKASPNPRALAAPTKQYVGADGSSPGAQTLPIRDLTHITQREATGQEAAVPPVRRGR